MGYYYKLTLKLLDIVTLNNCGNPIEFLLPNSTRSLKNTKSSSSLQEERVKRAVKI